MVDAPGIVVTGQQANEWRVTGQHQTRVESILTRLSNAYPALSPMHLHVEAPAPVHQGWGTGTQMALAIAKLCFSASNLVWSSSEAAKVLGRGGRSGIGIMGFDQGGLILDSGKSESGKLVSPVQSIAIPDSWTFVLVEPGNEQGLHSEEERRAFSRLNQVDVETVAQLRTLAKEVLIKAAVQGDFITFVHQLTVYNRLAGSFYRSVQHGDYSTPQTEERLGILEEAGAIGRGQSSWGPGLFAVFPTRQEAEQLTKRCHLPGCQMLVAPMLNSGAKITQSEEQ
jgi:beta-ribofuranosylaminobenzene 5'-phosphate synthase